MAKNFDDHPWVKAYILEGNPFKHAIGSVRRYVRWLAGRGMSLNEAPRQLVAAFIKDVAPTIKSWRTARSNLARFYDFLDQRSLAPLPLDQFLATAPIRPTLLQSWIEQTEQSDPDLAARIGHEYLSFLQTEGAAIKDSDWLTIKRFYATARQYHTRTGRRALHSLQEYLIWNGYVLETRLLTTSAPEGRDPTIEEWVETSKPSPSRRAHARAYGAWLHSQGRKVIDTTFEDVDRWADAIFATPRRKTQLRSDLRDLYKRLALDGLVLAKRKNLTARQVTMANLAPEFRELVEAWEREAMPMASAGYRAAQVIRVAHFLAWMQVERLGLSRYTADTVRRYMNETSPAAAHVNALNLFSKHLHSNGHIVRSVLVREPRTWKRRNRTTAPSDVEQALDVALRSALETPRENWRRTRLLAAVVGRLIFETGLQLTSVRNLSRQDVRLESGELIIRSGNSNEGAILALTPQGANAIRTWISEADRLGWDTNPLLFGADANNHIVSGAIKRAVVIEREGKSASLGIHELLAAHAARYR